MTSIGKTNYGLAVSFYNQRCNVCTLEKKPGEKPQKLQSKNGKELSWNQNLGYLLTDSVNKLTETVTEVAKLQAAENASTNMHDYTMPIAIAWPGYQAVGTNDLQEWETHKPGVNYKNSPDNTIANICAELGTAAQAYCRAGVRHGIFKPIDPNYRETVNNLSADLTAKLKSLYERATPPISDQNALDELKQEARKIALNRVTQSLNHPILPGHRSWFYVFELNHHRYLNLPEVREAMKETMERVLGHRIRIKFPGDPSNDHFFDIVAPIIETLSEKES